MQTRRWVKSAGAAVSRVWRPGVAVVTGILLFGSLNILDASEAAAGAAETVETYPEILESVDVGLGWSVHRIAPPRLLTRDGLQYVLYYDQDRWLHIAQRELGSDQWAFHAFPVQMGWATGGHGRLALAVDRDGYIHLAAYRRSLQRGPPSPPNKIYYRSEKPHDIGSFERLHMVSEQERPDYPTFYPQNLLPDHRLFFTYRDGRSGAGDQRINVYDPETRSWAPAFDTPLLDGRGRMNAYVHGPGGPVPGPDGRWHLLWVWRDTPCHASNHSLSYARTRGADLGEWETAAGAPVAPPFSAGAEGLRVDPAGPNQGISNMAFRMGWDSRNRPVITYHKFDEDGNSQIYNARFDEEAGRWHRVQATDWAYRWEPFAGAGAIPSLANGSIVTPAGEGRLHQDVRHDGKHERLVLDERTLETVARGAPPPSPAWRRHLLKPESSFMVPPIEPLRRAGGPMSVDLIEDKGGCDEEGVRYILRQEHAGNNRDQPIPRPWPEPTMLRVYKISTPE